MGHPATFVWASRRELARKARGRPRLKPLLGRRDCFAALESAAPLTKVRGFHPKVGGFHLESGASTLSQGLSPLMRAFDGKTRMMMKERDVGHPRLHAVLF